MSWLEITKRHARPCYTAYKCWEREKMVALPPSAWFCEHKGPSGEMLLCLHPPQGLGAGPWCTPVADAQSLQAGPPLFPRRKGKSGRYLQKQYVSSLWLCSLTAGTSPRWGHCVLKQTSRKYFIFPRQEEKACHHPVHFYYLKGH